MFHINVVLTVLILLSIILTTASLYFYNIGIARRRKDFLKDNPDLEVTSPNQVWDSASNWLEKQTVKEIKIVSCDGLTLHCSYIEAKSPTKKTVILAHGYSSIGKSMGEFARFYHEELGFNVLMPDNRGHGQSEGNYIGFGWHDRKDYLRWIDFIVERNGKESQIILHGVSMGGGTVLMTSGEELPESVKCIISDCAYTSAKDILSYQMRRMYKLPSFPLIYFTSFLCKLRAGYYFGEASALKQVSKAKVPILFIHGEKDTFVPTRMVYALYESCKSYKELLLIPEAGHGNAFFTDRKIYTDKVINFIKNTPGVRC